jgi:hypothetical protein
MKALSSNPHPTKEKKKYLDLDCEIYYLLLEPQNLAEGLLHKGSKKFIEKFYHSQKE